MQWRCPLCSVFVTVFLLSLLGHIRQKHGADTNFRIQCFIDNCHQILVRAESFYKHVKRHHARHLEDSINNVQTNNIRAEPEQPISGRLSSEHGTNSNDGSDTHDDEHDEHESDTHGSSGNENMDANRPTTSETAHAPCSPHPKRRAAAFILNMKSRCKLTQKSTEMFINGTQAFHMDSMNSLKRKLHERFQQRTANFSGKDIDEIFDSIADPFEELRDEYSFMQYISKFNYVEPVKKVLGKATLAAGRGPKRKLVEKEDVFYYVPIMETLKKLMENKRFRDEIEKTHTSTSEKMEDYCNGTHFRDHPFFALHPDALQILLYYDDVELCNPLGSKSKIHKMGFFYFTFTNIHPKFRSKLSGINLLSICPAKFLTQDSYGLDAVLQPLLEELRELENGIEITVCGENRLVHGVVTVIAADTLAANALGGFKEGVGFSFRKCRDCMISADDMRSLFRADQFVKRTAEGYSLICDKLENAVSSELRDIYSTSYGINRRSVLESFPYFNVVECIPQDVMHVLLEGCLPYTTKQVLKYYIQNKQSFTLAQLNHQIQNFEFGYVDRANKPTLLQNSALDDDGQLRQSSSQMWTLGRFLPLMIGKFIELDGTCQVWQCFILLLQIMNICFSPMIQKEDIVTLEEIVEYHLKLFKKCFQVNIIPKQHYMCHIAEQMRKFGPLVRFWCMRYEAKHAFFKSHCHSANFKNIAYYMAKRHQLSCVNHQMDLYAQDKPHEMFHEINQGPSTLLNDQEYGKSELIRCSIAIDNNTPIYVTNWVEFNGCTFKQDCFFVYDFKDGMPIFAQVNSIWVVENIPLFRATLHSTVSFRDDINVFEIDQTPEAAALETVSASTLKVPYVFCSYSLEDEDYSFIVPKSDIRMFDSYN